MTSAGSWREVEERLRDAVFSRAACYAARRGAERVGAARAEIASAATCAALVEGRLRRSVGGHLAASVHHGDRDPAGPAAATPASGATSFSSRTACAPAAAAAASAGAVDVTTTAPASASPGIARVAACARGGCPSARGKRAVFLRARARAPRARPSEPGLPGWQANDAPSG